MTGVLCIAVCMALLWFEVSNRRFQSQVLSLLGQPKKSGGTRHLSPHRRAVDEKRRTEQ